VALPEDLADAERTGRYRMSTRGRTVDEIGFVHLAYEHQCRGVLARYYSDRPDAVVLVLDPERLASEVRDEPSDDGGGAFPHLYGELPLDAVLARVGAGADG
jgi:glutathione S-transferase